MNRRSAPTSSRSPAGRTAAARASASRAYAARASESRGQPSETSSRSATSAPSPATSSSRARGKQRGSNASAPTHSAGTKASRPPGQRPNVRVVPRGVKPKDHIQASPKRMKVNVSAAGASPASTVTTISSRTSASTPASSDTRSTKSSSARSSGVSTTMRKLVMEKNPKKQALNIFMADLYNENHLFALYCNKADPSEDEKDDFINAPFPDRLHDVLGCHTMSENKAAYAKLCSDLGVYCDPEKVASEKKIKAALKELVWEYYAEIK